MYGGFLFYMFENTTFVEKTHTFVRVGLFRGSEMGKMEIKIDIR